MTKLSWDETDSRYFTTGVDRGVLFLQEGIGVAWNGLVSVNETPSGSDLISNFYDGSKFFSDRKPENMAGVIEAYTYPQEFEEYIGQTDFLTTQNHKSFSFSYRTLLSNGQDPFGERHIIHIVYNAMVDSPQIPNRTMDATPKASTFSWDFVTTPMKMGRRLGSHIMIDTGIAKPEVVAELEDILYGTDDSFSVLPNPETLIEIFESAATLRIIDHGDGTWSAEGPDGIIQMLSSTMFEITWPSAIYIDSETYEISSL